MIVLDASVVVEWLAGGPGAERILLWLERHEGLCTLQDSWT